MNSLRKGLSDALSFLLPLLLSICLPIMLAASGAEAATGGSVATLYRGQTALGEIPVADEATGFVLSVADAGMLLGFDVAVVGEELVMVRDKQQLRLVLDAVAAWHNNSLIPLYSSSFVKGGRWWLDATSALSVLQRAVGKGADNQLRVEQTAMPASSAPQQPDLDSSTLTASVSPGNSAPEAEPTQTSSEAMNAQGSPSAAEKQPAPAESKSPKQQKQTPAAAKNVPPQAADVRGTVRALRWSTSQEKIRAVIDCTDEATPEMKASPGKVVLSFAGALDDPQGLPSPYQNVKADMVKGAKETTLTFSAAAVKVEKLVLDSPRRIVLDFYFAASTKIEETATVAAIESTSSPSQSAAPRKGGRKLVVLDPGHGGKDPGAVANGFKEKDINLAVGLKLEKALQAKGLDVHMTRRTDVYLKLQERTDIANQKNAHMFVSIHVNALPPGKNSSGFEIYLMALPTDKDALALAKIENKEFIEDKTRNGVAVDRKTELLLQILGDMQQNEKINESTVVAEVLFKAGNQSGLPMKQVRQAPFFVLRGAGMPAVLLEMGFLTNAKEAKLLAHSGYQQKIADSMADGINDYLKQLP